MVPGIAPAFDTPMIGRSGSLEIGDRTYVRGEAE